GGGALRLAGAGAAARGLARAALALDGPAVSGLLAESLAADGIELTWDDLVRPVLAAIADRWAHTGAGAEVEHLVSECVLAVFGAHRRAAPPAAGARPVLLAAMPGELHTLPIVALAVALAHRGVAHRYLGANLPADALIAAVRRTAPAAVVLWAQVGDTADAAVLAQLPPARPLARAFAAGPGWEAATLPPRAERLGSLPQAMAAIAGTVPA
ncbi:B12-binding domain-containing protein, partial [Pseudonocardia aurantiaca]